VQSVRATGGHHDSLANPFAQTIRFAAAHPSVEDEPFVREATRSILAHAGFEVLPAENASEAMQIYEQRIAPSFC